MAMNPLPPWAPPARFVESDGTLTPEAQRWVAQLIALVMAMQKSTGV